MMLTAELEKLSEKSKNVSSSPAATESSPSADTRQDVTQSPSLHQADASRTTLT